jgi:hypothetical protein
MVGQPVLPGTNQLFLTPKGNHSNENENHLFPKERNLHFPCHVIFTFGGVSQLILT